MTRFLSQSLQAVEPAFRHGISQLEAAHRHPNTDIRLSTEIQHAARKTLVELGLDPSDTTPEELYQALQSRIASDDKLLQRTLQTTAATYVSAEADVVAGMIHSLQSLPESKRCYAIKPASFKSIVKRIPPKRVMKQLGYRSLESFLKHESPAVILSTMVALEDARHIKRFRQQYTRLRPTDFEDRPITIQQMEHKKWPDLKTHAHLWRQTVFGFPELGAVMILPLPADVPAGTVTATLTLALRQLNEVRATSTYLKLSQVRPHFGDIVAQVSTAGPQLQATMFDQPVSWQIVQRFYARHTGLFHEALFEPHISAQDMVWRHIEDSLHAIEPKLAFWRQTSHVGILHGSRPVSCNILDAAFNLCNRLPFEQRSVGYYQANVWQQLMLRYLHPESVEQALMQELNPQMAPEMAMA